CALPIFEPHAGTGAFVRALRVALPGARIVANDVQPLMAEWRQAGADECRIGDFAGMRGEYDAIVGNPPFSLAERHVRHALALLAPGGVLAFLLRLAFVETRSRFALLREHPLRALYALSERPSFTGGGSDMACYGVFVWQRGGAGPAVFRVLAASTGRVA